MKLRWLLPSVLALVFLAGALQFASMMSWWHKSSVNAYESVYIDIKPGSSVKQIAEQLYQAGIINNKSYFIWLVRLRGTNNTMKAGDYLLPPAFSPSQVYSQLQSGRVLQYAVTLVEGWTFNQVITELTAQSLLKHDLQGLTSTQIMQKLGLPDKLPEGLFFPNTYFYVRGASESLILKKAYKTMQAKLDSAWQTRDANLPYKTPYDALIAASIIEKESALPSERPFVASVLVNRLNRGMPLQMDPTVIYGLGAAYDGNIKSSDLKRKTDYNTYLFQGLPPTPIAMPGASSLNAALHPADTNYLYFVANGQGSHQFSSSLSQHDKAVKAYLKQLKKRND
ncbi:MAG: endolytic transglycosylase MltG [Gammaproteobacteria bacterium]|nr:endolytic transglycosylase MltG [Gammaproteobacteria bacterium]